MKYLSSLKNKNLFNQICLLRVDFNLTDDDLKKQKVPLRVKAVLPTIKFLTERGAKVVILSHRGRPPKVSSFKFQVSSYTLKPFAAILSELLRKSVQFLDFKKDFRTIKAIIEINPRSAVFLLENLRFLPGEDKNDRKLAKRLAGLGTFYVNDAFAFSHRKNASTVAITRFLPSYTGLLLEKEIENLSAVMKKPRHPLIVILGGAKISDKIGVIKNFLKKADYILAGGGMANTFFAAQGLPIGDSLYEKEMVPLARRLLKSKKIILPIDSVMEKRKIFDIGPKTTAAYTEIIKKARTVIWNGPMGYIENPKFAKGTISIIKAILANKKAFAIVGGGETTSLMSKVKSQKSKVFISTGGGAMLEYLAGKKLPGVEALKK